MAPKNKPESKTKPEIKKDHFEALLENMNDNIKLVAEGQAAFRDEFTDFRDETRANFKTIFEFRDETQANFKTLFEFRDETRANFKIVFDYLSRIDNELQDIKKELKLLDETKVDKQKFNDLTQRVARLERKLEECKDSLEAKK